MLAFWEKQSKFTKELTFFEKCKFLGSSRKVVQLKIEHNLWQPIVNQPL